MLVWTPYLHDEASLRVWLGEVQEFMRHISQRACAGYRLWVVVLGVADGEV